MTIEAKSVTQKIDFFMDISFQQGGMITAVVAMSNEGGGPDWHRLTEMTRCVVSHCAL
jgi:hypothetical protein